MGGLEKVLCEYLCLLKENTEYSITVFSLAPVTEPFFLDFFKKNEISYVDTLGKVNPYLFRFIAKRLFSRKLIKFFKQFDIVIDFASLYFYRELRSLSCYKIGWIHGSINFCNLCIKEKRLSPYDKIICLSDSFFNDFKMQYPEFADRIARIYNPINADYVNEQAEHSYFDAEPPYFVAVQRLDVDKDVETIINAFNIFSVANKEYKLYIVGTGKKLTELQELAKNNSNIIFTGQLPDSYAIIKNAAALILSSTKNIGEGLPNTLLEAQALGTLAITSNVKSGPAEIVLNGEAGFLFEPHNAEDLMQVLTYVANNPEICANKIKAAAENLSRFTLDKRVIELLKL